MKKITREEEILKKHFGYDNLASSVKAPALSAMRELARERWNEAIKEGCKEILKYNGIVPNKADRENMSEAIEKKLLYKSTLK